jgi:hypothetical protein
MNKVFLLLTLLFSFAINAFAQDINAYKFALIQHQDDAPKDIEERMSKEFAQLGFTIVTEDDYSQFSADEKSLVLLAEYRCRQSAQCLFHIWLKNSDGKEVYEDEQVAAAGFMSRKNDRQSAIKKIFKELKKLRK